MKRGLFAVITLGLLGAPSIFADSFVCTGTHRHIQITIQNYLSKKTRTVEKIVISNPTTKAEILSVTGKKIHQVGSLYSIRMNSKDEETQLLERRLADLDSITVRVLDFNFNDKNKNGKKYRGFIALVPKPAPVQQNLDDQENLNCTYSLQNLVQLGQ
ncbi:hypothetical protein K2X30_11430 [bacterium]|nr:hypothetical protein [bacterium]